MFQTWDSCLDVNGIATLRCIPIIFKNIISFALLFVGAVTLILIMYAGLTMSSSQGDSKKVEKAKKIITWSITGLIMVLLSFAVIYLIGYTTGSAACITSFTDIDKFISGCNNP